MNDKEKLRQEFKTRIYKYILRLVKFLSALPNVPVLREIIGQLMRSGTSIGANYFEAQSASSKKDYQNFFNHSLKSPKRGDKFSNLLLPCDPAIPGFPKSRRSKSSTLPVKI